MADCLSSPVELLEHYQFSESSEPFSLYLLRLIKRVNFNRHFLNIPNIDYHLLQCWTVFFIPIRQVASGGGARLAFFVQDVSLHVCCEKIKTFIKTHDLFALEMPPYSKLHLCIVSSTSIHAYFLDSQGVTVRTERNRSCW